MAGIGRTIPGKGDKKLRERGWELWTASASVSLPDGARPLLDTVFGHSFFLTDCAVSEPSVVLSYASGGPEAALVTAREALPSEKDAVAMPEAEFAKMLRIGRRRAALAIALGDITQDWPVQRTLAEWSDFACNLLRISGFHLLGSDADKSGYAIIALGKLGANELNYSSDIDFVVFYDSEAECFPEEARNGEAERHFTRLTRRLVKLFEERTADGYLFRTDLRLRPDPSSTPVAVSVEFAKNYYASLGQNWERAVFIRARSVAGDIEAGERFLEQISPFVWRRQLDFAAVKDIQAMQRQVRRGRKEFQVEGFNLKLGAGGIRDIEFFLQTRQLTWGGRDITMRKRGTAEGLAALAFQERLEPESAEALTRLYRYLRTVENRVQMMRDEQTHEVPKDVGKRSLLSSFLGYQNLAAFEEDLRLCVEEVQETIAACSGDDNAGTLALPEGGNLVFTGVDPDPDTLTTLSGLGFSAPEKVIRQISGWHRGRIPATRNERGREILTEITPSLIDAFSRTSDPDAAHAGFARFAEGLRAGVETFSLFQSNPTLLRIVTQVMGSAPLVGETLAARPWLLDHLLHAPLDRPLPRRIEMEEALENELSLGRGDYQDDLDAFRRWAGELRIMLAVKLLEGLSNLDETSRTLTTGADLVLERLSVLTAHELALEHGEVKGAAVAFLALGKLGGETLLPGSDLDFVFLFDAGEGDPLSDGKRPLPSPLYFNRLANRTVTAFSAPTGEGMLWEIDLRLRPYGSDGPLATPLHAYERYFMEEALPVEILTLVRSRVITTDKEFGARINAVVERALVEGRTDRDLAGGLRDLRGRIAKTHGTRNPFAVKHIAGGLLDLELFTQYLAVTCAREIKRPIRGRIPDVLDTLAREGAIDTETAGALAEAERLYRSVQGVLRLTLRERYDPDKAPRPLNDFLGRITGLEVPGTLQQKLEEAQAMVWKLFDRHVVPKPEKQEQQT